MFFPLTSFEKYTFTFIKTRADFTTNTKNKDAKTIAGIVYTHRENARILHNAYGGNIGKLEGYEGRTRYSATKLVNYGEKNYIKWVL
jgi:hypothetical protein